MKWLGSSWDGARLGLALALVSSSTACDDRAPLGDLRDPSDPFTVPDAPAPGPEVDPETAPFGGADPVLLENVPFSPEGGTLLITSDGRRAVVADQDRDVLHVVDLQGLLVAGTLTLPDRSRPGRMVEDDAGLVHLTLQQAGKVVTLDPAGPTALGTRTPCAAPMGIAHDRAADEVLVACAGGDLVRLAADPEVEDARSSVRLLPDLRDVVVDEDGTVFVSRFRSAELLLLGDDDRVAEHVSLDFLLPENQTPRVAWRMVAQPGGGVLVLHQLQSNDLLPAATNAYYHPALAGAMVTGYPIANNRTRIVDPQLYVDLAVSPGGGQLGVATAAVTEDPRGATGRLQPLMVGDRFPPNSRIGQRDDVLAVTFAPDGELWAQVRDPAALVNSRGMEIPLSPTQLTDTGYELFHLLSPSGLTCAHCHPGGGDDGHTWNFEAPGPRRTQSLRGPLLGSEPFHWGGDVPDFRRIVDVTMSERMLVNRLTDDQVAAIERYSDEMPTVRGRAADDIELVARGWDVFNSPASGCASCHSGERFTNDRTVELVGSGDLRLELQVPSLLNLALRAPYLHDGRADTIEEALGMALGHEEFARLPSEDRRALLAYLDTI